MKGYTKHPVFGQNKTKRKRKRKKEKKKENITTSLCRPKE
jgi:hypothetical protein